jgi:hypothetical protein
LIVSSGYTYPDADLRLVGWAQLRRAVELDLVAKRADDGRAAPAVEQQRHLQRREEADVDLAGAHALDLSGVAAHDGHFPSESGGALESGLDGRAVGRDGCRLLRRRECENDRTVE